MLSLGLIALLSIGTYVNLTQGNLGDSSTDVGSSGDEPTTTPVSTLTFTEWRSETETYIEMWVYVALDDRTEGWGEDQVVLHYRNFPAGVNVEDIISFVAVMDGVDSVHHVPELTVKALEVE